MVLVLLTLAGAVFATQLSISTSRFGLVSEDNWYQRRMIDFFDAFGYPDSPVATVQGGSPEQRRQMVDALVEELEKDPLFTGRVVAKIDAEAVAETMLVREPGMIADFRAQLPPDADFPAALEGGLEGVFGLLEAQMLAALDGEVELDPERAKSQLERLTALAKALDDKLAEDAGQGDPVDAKALIEAVAGEEASAGLPTEADMRERGLDPEGYLVSNDGERLLVALFPEIEDDEVEDYEPTVQALRDIRERLPAIGDVEVVYTGLPFLVVDEEKTLQEGLLRSSIAAGLGIFVLLMWAFRSIRRTLVAVVPIVVGTIVSLGVLYLLYDNLDPITSSFAAVLMGLSIDFSVHLLARYDEDLRKGLTRGEALMSALRKAGPGVVTGAVTTALAFLTVATTEFTSYGEMGVITAIGLCVALFTALLILPVILGRGDLDAKEDPKRPFEGLAVALAPVKRAPIVVLVVGITLAGIGVAASPPYDPAFFDFLPRDYESTIALQQLEKDGAMSPWFAWTTADDLEQARAQADALREFESVARVDSPSDLLPELSEDRLQRMRADFTGLERAPDWDALARREVDPASLAVRTQGIVDALDELAFAAEQADQDPKIVNDASEAFAGLQKRLETLPTARSKATLARIEADMARFLGPAWTTASRVAERGHWLPSDLPDSFESRFVSKDGSRLAVFVYPAGDVASGDDRNALARQFTHDLESVDPEAAGQGVSLYRHNEMIWHGFRRASFFSVCLVVLLLLLDFASLRKSLLALVPVLVGMGWMVGIYAIFDLRFNVATIMVLPLMLGIGIDAGVHMMHRWELNTRHHGKAKIDEVVRGTGGAVTLSSMTTMVGFAGLLVGRHLGMVQLGATMVIGIGCTLVSSVVVLPALLLALDEAE